MHHIWSATIATDAVDINDPVDVVIPDFDDTMRWGPCRWQSRGDGILPVRDDEALLSFDNRRSPWIVAWWPNRAVSPVNPANLAPGVNGQYLQTLVGLAQWATPGPWSDADIAAAANVEGSKFNWHVGAAPPSSPSNGMLWIYSGTGFYWVFVYDSSETTYKWKFVGGSPLLSTVDTDETFTAGLNWADPATAGPSITLPRDGDYDYIMSAEMYTTAAGNVNVQNGLSIAGANPGAPHIGSVPSGLAGVPIGTSTVSNRVTGRTASQVLKQQYLCPTATAHTRYRSLKVWPVRVI